MSWIESKNKKSDKLQKEIDDYSATIDKIQSDVTSKETELSTLLSEFSIDGMVKDIITIIASIIH